MWYLKWHKPKPSTQLEGLKEVRSTWPRLLKFTTVIYNAAAVVKLVANWMHICIIKTSWKGFHTCLVVSTSFIWIKSAFLASSSSQWLNNGVNIFTSWPSANKNQATIWSVGNGHRWVGFCLRFQCWKCFWKLFSCYHIVFVTKKISLKLVEMLKYQFLQFGKDRKVWAIPTVTEFILWLLSGISDWLRWRWGMEMWPPTKLSGLRSWQWRNLTSIQVGF